MYTIHITTIIAKNDLINTDVPAATSVVSFETKVEAEIAIKQLNEFRKDNDVIIHFPIRLYIP